MVVTRSRLLSLFKTQSKATGEKGCEEQSSRSDTDDDLEESEEEDQELKM